MSEARKDERSTAEACVAAGSIGRGRRHTGNAAPHAKPRHPRRTLRRWQRGHTLAMLAINAVFHAPMSALKLVVHANACEPSHKRPSLTDRARTFCGADTCAPTPTRAPARTDAHVGALVSHARIGDPILHVVLRRDIEMRIDCVYKYHIVASMPL